MLKRTKNPKHKNCFLINDVPVKIELEEEEKFSSNSNMGLLTSLRTGRINNFNSKKVENFKGINSLDIHCTYLDHSYYGKDIEEFLENNVDFTKEFKKRKELERYENILVDSETNTPYYLLPFQKDLYVSERLWGCINETIEEIKQVNPKFIIITGKWSLFLLCGVGTFVSNAPKGQDRKPLGGLSTYRSSILSIHECWGNIEAIVIPIYHPVHGVSMPDKVPTMELDIQKVGWMYYTILEKGIEYYKKPQKNYILGTTKELVINYLSYILEELDKKETYISVDIETMFSSIIDCIGLAIKEDEGFCIPFASIDNPNIWSIEDEIEIMIKLREVLLHPNALHIGQNYSYDCQYFYHKWGLNISPKEDTMVLHHILYNYLPKDLAFMASLYCEWYSWWKGEIDATKETPETRWIYNCKDICYTLEIANVLLDLIKNDSDKRLYNLYRFQIDSLHPELVLTMNTGVKVDKERKESLYKFFSEILEQIPEKINNLLGFEFNPNSHPQKKKLFTEYFGIKLITKKVKGRGTVETCDAKAMLYYMDEYPEYKPFLTILAEYSALSKFTKNFLGMKLDEDNRARTQYKITGTKLGRLASTKNVWGGGSNFQNLPEKGKLPIKYLFELLGFTVNKEELDDLENFINNTEEEIDDAEYSV